MYYPPVENTFWRQFVSLFEKINGEKIVYALVLLFPIFTVSVRHWASTIFGVFAIISLILLYFQRNDRTQLLKEEKILVWSFAAYFGVFILTSIVNGWGQVHTRYMGVDIRFLLFVPMYLVIRQMNDWFKWLLTGCAIGIIATSIDGINDILLNKTIVYNVAIYKGIYSPLFTGPVTLIFVAVLMACYPVLSSNKWIKLILIMLCMLALFVVVHTGARNAYLALIVFGLLFVFNYFKGVRRWVLLGFSAIIIATSILTIDIAQFKLNRAVVLYEQYFKIEDPAKHQGGLTSVGTRLEMWRITPLFFKDNPVFGVSRGKYSTEVKKYINNGLAHPDSGKHGHPHNIYSEIIISKGLVGLLSFFMLTIYPLFILIRDFRKNINSAFPGILLIVGYLIFSLTDASTFIKGNYVAVYIIFLSVLFSYHMQNKQNMQTRLE